MSLESQIGSISRKIRLNNNLNLRPEKTSISTINQIWDSFESIEGKCPVELLASPQVYIHKESEEDAYLVKLNRSPTDREIRFLPFSHKDTPICYISPTNMERLRLILHKKRY